ncbi:BlaI/MecI/CopY family transcriptional regulator [Streptomyces sp. NPDC053427]|uniref:BlaI/MecI/CopY family transcriptional regulator n=1 Tax=Streptomyces sp. NPDC053427 TaxID=3365701 RepID=UPI0037D96C86
MTEERGDRRPSGELEARVLAALWAADVGLAAGEVRAALGSGLARTTVTTLLLRLYEKGIVTRSRSGRGYAYAMRPVIGISAPAVRLQCSRRSTRL